jgi:hypothetical protein
MAGSGEVNSSSGTRDGRFAAARLGAAFSRCWRRPRTIEHRGSPRNSTRYFRLHAMRLCHLHIHANHQPFMISIFRRLSVAASNQQRDVNSLCSSLPTLNIPYALYARADHSIGHRAADTPPTRPSHLSLDKEAETSRVSRIPACPTRSDSSLFSSRPRQS